MSDATGLESIRYRGWSEHLRPAWLAIWPIATTGLRLVLRRKLYWLILALGLFHFLFFFAVIYLKWQIRVENPGFAQFVDRVLESATGAGKTYRDFLSKQGLVTMVLLALAGEVLVGGDFQHGGLTFYLSRRVGRLHYLLGKLLAIGLLVAMVTTLPALVLYLEYGLLGDGWAYFRDEWRILLGIFGYGLAMAATLSLLLMAMAAWLRTTVPMVMGWACVFVLAPALGRLLSVTYHQPRWQLLALWRDIYLLGTWCFNALSPKESLLLAPASWLVLAVAVVSLAAIVPTIRAVKVVA